MYLDVRGRPFGRLPMCISTCSSVARYDFKDSMIWFHLYCYSFIYCLISNIIGYFKQPIWQKYILIIVLTLLNQTPQNTH